MFQIENSVKALSKNIYDMILLRICWYDKSWTHNIYLLRAGSFKFMKCVMPYLKEYDLSIIDKKKLMFYIKIKKNYKVNGNKQVYIYFYLQIQENI